MADVWRHLCESPPVHVGTSDEHMFLVDDPELGVEDALRQVPKVHLPHLNPYRQEETRMRESCCWRASQTKTHGHVRTSLF